jgi:hypothetical protein
MERIAFCKGLFDFVKDFSLLGRDPYTPPIDSFARVEQERGGKTIPFIDRKSEEFTCTNNTSVPQTHSTNKKQTIYKQDQISLFSLSLS